MPEKPDQVLLRLAGRQHGIVARWQAVAAGVTATALDGRIRRGMLERVYHCVYRISALCDDRTSECALILSCGPHAVASHGTAALLHGLRSPSSGTRALSVSVARGRPALRENVQLHRVRLEPDERTVCDGIPVTTPGRTLLDLAATLPDRPLEQALATALRAGLVTEASVGALLARYPGRQGTPRLNRLLPGRPTAALTRSEAEERFLHLLRRAQMVEPAVNARVLGFEVDFYWPAGRLVVEIDGLAYHSSRSVQRSDRRRDAALVGAGFRVFRLTWSDLIDRPEATVAVVASALARSGMPGR